jgi:hypothetical protein
MRVLRPVHLTAAALAIVAVVAGGSALAAGKKSHEDKQRGFRVQIGDKFELVPPKLTAEGAHVVGNWYCDAAKFDGGQRPEFKIWWFATPKAPTVTPGANDKPEAQTPATPEEILRQARGEAVPTSADEAFDDFFKYRGNYFDNPPSGADFWKAAKKAATKAKVEAQYVEVNDPDTKKSGKKKKDKQSAEERYYEAYALAAKLTLDRPGETVEVGFLGYCGMDFVKDGKKSFLDIVRSFEDLAKIATDSRNVEAHKELDPDDPEAFRAQIKKTKLIKGWACYDTPHYVVLYPDKEVDPGLAKTIATQIESLRAQVYEAMYPPEKPIKAISVIRCCKDSTQYIQYSGLPGSAGYWYPPGMELVFYEDKGAKTDSLRVLYHEGFHQYIHYALGAADPHTWFNEGNAEYFFGYDYVNGKWQRGSATWRRDEARKAKREKKFPTLLDWLNFSHRDYMGGNKLGLQAGENYALGWDFVAFLRTTKKKEYQGILDKYFVTLRGLVSKARDAREELERRIKGSADPSNGGDGTDEPADPAEPGEPPEPPAPKPAEPVKPQAPSLEEVVGPQQWLSKAFEEAFKGIDMKQLEKDWLNAD